MPNHNPSNHPVSSLQSPITLLKSIFGYEDFRPLQADIIANVQQQRDTLVIMPTGGGKSLCFQIPALLLDGLTVVVSPLISLMDDQVTQLRQLNVPAAYLNSTLSYSEYLETVNRVKQGQIKLVYMAPETLLRPETLVMLEGCQLDMLAIDEAHCISQWGHDFRPEYRQIVDVRRRFPHAVCIALTATATTRVREDIRQTLNFQDRDEFVASFDRPNLAIVVRGQRNAAQQVLDFISEHADQSGIIYCSTRKKVEEMCGFLLEHDIRALPYHGGMENSTRAANQTAFIRDNVNVMVATIAFGMGIDKPDVRFVLHADLPKDVENYYQQIGRAGRDSLPADCLLLYSRGDVRTQLFFIEQGAEEEGAGRRQRLNQLVQWAESGKCRRQLLLAYFGEDYAGGDNCGNCDNCLRDDAKQVDVTVPAQKFLSCIFRTGQRFGANHVINVLRGSKAKRVLEFGHDQVSTYGIGMEFSALQWQHLARQFVQQGLLTQDPEYSTLKLTAVGTAVLKGQQPVLAMLDEEKVESGSRGEPVEFDAALFGLLRNKRKELADEASVPPYMIFADRSLQEMASYFPHSPATLETIHGVGQAKVQRYADDFLPVLVTYCAEHDLEEKPKASKKIHATRSTIRKSRSDEVGERYADGSTIQQLQDEYGVQRRTIVGHLAKYVQAGNALPLDQIRAESTLSAEGQAQVLAAFDEVGADFLRPVFEFLQEQVAYDEIDILRIVYWAGKG